jgi:hypothetical protein
MAQECGPRFVLKLLTLQHGTFDTKSGEYEWVHKVLLFRPLIYYLPCHVHPYNSMWCFPDMCAWFCANRSQPDMDTSRRRFFLWWRSWLEETWCPSPTWWKCADRFFKKRNCCREDALHVELTVDALRGCCWRNFVDPSNEQVIQTSVSRRKFLWWKCWQRHVSFVLISCFGWMRIIVTQGHRRWIALHYITWHVIVSHPPITI